MKEVARFYSEFRGKNLKFLDLGCGSGRNFAAVKGAIYGIDFSEEQIKAAKETARALGIDARLYKFDIGKDKLPFDDEFFDGVVFMAALHCLETKEERKFALMEAWRVLKKGGKMLISVWDKKGIEKGEGAVSWEIEGEKVERFYYFYEKQEIESLLGKNRFEMEKDISNKQNFIYIAVKR